MFIVVNNLVPGRVSICRYCSNLIRIILNSFLIPLNPLTNARLHYLVQSRRPTRIEWRMISSKVILHLISPGSSRHYLDLVDLHVSRLASRTFGLDK